MENNKLFKEYTEWCEKNKKDPLNTKSVDEFHDFKMKEMKEQEEKTKKEFNKELVSKQEEIFKLFCQYCGVKTKYDAELLFEGLDSLIKSAVAAACTVNHKKDVTEILDKIFD